MKLSENDTKLFYKLMNNLLCYVNKKVKIIKNRKFESHKDFIDNPISFEDVANLQDELFSNISIIDKVVDKNPYSFNQEEISIIKSWKNFICDNFFIIKHLKKYTTIFQEKTNNESYVYWIKWLYDSIGDIVDEKQMVKMTLLPFKEHIIYSWIITWGNMYFWGWIMSWIMEMYNESKLKYWIIESIPFDPKKGLKNDEELLIEYLKTEKNEEKYWDEIISLKYKNKKLENLFHQRRNRLYSKFYKKEYKINSVTWFFAIYNTLPVAIAKNKKDLEKRISVFVEKTKINQVYIFQIK